MKAQLCSKNYEHTQKIAEFLTYRNTTPPSSFVSAKYTTDMVNGIQIRPCTDRLRIQREVSGPLAELFWGISDGVKNGKIKPQYLDLSGVSSQWILNGANISYTGGNNGIGNSCSSFLEMLYHY